MHKILQQNTNYTYIVHHEGIICKTSPICFVHEIFTSEDLFYETSTSTNSEDLDIQSQHI